MARKEVVIYRVCDMPHRGEVRAESTETVVLNGHRWQIDLCPKDSEALAHALAKFTDHATKTGEPSVFEKAKPARSVSVPTRRPVPVPAFEEPKRAELPHSAERWRLTQHAVERMQERGLNLYDVLFAAERPENVTPDPKRQEGIEQHVRGDILVIVNPQTTEVLTCGRLTADRKVG